MTLTALRLRAAVYPTEANFRAVRAKRKALAERAKRKARKFKQARA